jgi:hypothetical protein
MKRNRLLVNLAVIAIFLFVGFGCKNVKIPFGGDRISEATDPKEAVQTAHKKFMDAKFYHSVVKTKNANAAVETEIDFNAPDRFWIKNNVANYKSEVIAVGNDSYSRTNDGKWTKMPAGQALSASDMRGKMADEYFASMKDFEAAGKDNLNGKEAFVYKFKSPTTGASTMWISADTGMPLRIDSEGDYNGTPTYISASYDYETETKIEIPKVN